MASLAPPPQSNASQNATPPSSPTNSTTSSPPPSTTPSAPPPSTLTSPPPTTSPPAAPPPESPPPPSNTSSPPPSNTSSPPPTPSPQPPSPPTAPPPSTNSSTVSPPPAPPPSPGVIVSPPPPPPTGSPPPESPPTPAAPPANSTTPSPPPTSPPPPPRASSPENSPPTQPETPPPPSNRSSPSIPSTPPPSTNRSTNSSRPSVPLPAARPPPSRTAEVPTAGSTQPTSNTTSSNNSGGLNGAGVVAVGSIAALLALSLVALVLWCTCRRKKRKEMYSLRYNVPSPFASSQGSGSSFLRSNHNSTQLGGSLSASKTNYMHSPDGGGGLASSRSWFSYQELYEVTNGFSEYNILGEGGFGCVYKGVLPDGREVAVKQLKAGSGQGEREFQAEVEIISRIHHRHLVSLVGYCISENQRLLVYDYVPNDTLHHHLHTPGKKVMDWASRVKVAAGAARGMAYLHEDCQPRIIHRDIKSTNILLENNFEARVADFGLAKIAQDLDIQTHVSTRVMGTFGYMAPEYASTGKLTDKSDVYSFGVVLLELITGRKSIDSSQPVGDESLVEWARPLLTEALDKEEFEDIVDPNLGDNFVPSEMFRMIEAAAACVRHLASKRPKMSQVARALDSMDELADLNNGVRPGESGIFNSREHSAQLRVFQRMAFGSQEYSSEFLDNSHSSWSRRS